MKRIIILLCLSAGLLTVSCKKDNKPAEPPFTPPPTVTVEKPVIAVNGSNVILYPKSAGVTEEVTFEIASEEAVTVSATCSIAEVDISFDDETKKGKLTVSAKTDDQVKGSAVISATNPGGTEYANIVIESAYLLVPSEPVLIGGEAGVKTVEINSNVPIQASTETEWLVVNPAGESAVKLSFLANEDKLNERSASINVKDSKTGTLTATLTVKQSTAQDPLLVLSDEELLHRIYDKLTFEPRQNWDGTWAKKEEYLPGWFDEDKRMWTGVDFSGGRVVCLHLYGAPFNCEIPEEIGYLTNLKEIWIRGANDGKWKGTIPESFKQLTKLKDLSITGTAIEGGMPEWLPQLVNLRILDLYDNYLTGNLPLYLAEMPNLESFSFCLNCFDGKIDESLTKTKWWLTPSLGTEEYAGRPMGQIELEAGQKEGHRLWL